MTQLDTELKDFNCELHELNQLMNATIRRYDRAIAELAAKVSEQISRVNHLERRLEDSGVLPNPADDWGDDQDRCKDCGEELECCMCGEPEFGEVI